MASVAVESTTAGQKKRRVCSKRFVVQALGNKSSRFREESVEEEVVRVSGIVVKMVLGVGTNGAIVTIDDGTGTLDARLPPSNQRKENSGEGVKMRTTPLSSKRRKLSAKNRRQSFTSSSAIKAGKVTSKYESPVRLVPHRGGSNSEELRVGSLIEVMGELVRREEDQEGGEGGAEGGASLNASSFVVVQDPNFETLRMFEIASQPSSFPVVQQQGKKMDINKLLEGLTEGDFESMSQG